MTTTQPSLTTRLRRGPLVIIAGLTFIVVIGVVNVTSAIHDQRSGALAPSRLLQASLPAKAPDPEAFNEQRDGSNALSLEDRNGDVQIWDDTKTGARLFCRGSAPCVLLPHVHPRKH